MGEHRDRITVLNMPFNLHHVAKLWVMMISGISVQSTPNTILCFSEARVTLLPHAFSRPQSPMVENSWVAILPSLKRHKLKGLFVDSNFYGMLDFPDRPKVP